MPRTGIAHHSMISRVCVFGAESTGKTTLCQRLAEQFDSVWVPEYARQYLEAKGGEFVFDDVAEIARGQMELEKTAVPRAKRILFCDTDILTTTIWSRWFFGACPEWVQEQAAAQTYDLTLLTEVDVPWVEDSVRYLPEDRHAFQARCLAALESLGRPYQRIRGDWEARFLAARKAVERLLAG